MKDAGLMYDRARCLPALRDEPPLRMPEIEIQARLFAGEFGTSWTTLDGGEVEVLHFGEWNREAGPDFRGAKLRLPGGEERVGDIEVDPDPRDWETHGHSRNPGFAGVLLQLFVHNPGPRAFARTLENRAVHQARIQIERRGQQKLAGIPGTVDTASALKMISEAAAFRLRQKHLSHARAVSLHGPDTALFHAIATGLGYKNNALPFLLVAQRAGLRAAGGTRGEALLFGLAGFLQPRTFDLADEVTRTYLKPLWDEWWTMRDALTRLVLPASLWRLAGHRPQNHPHRRMGALAATARSFAKLRKNIHSHGAAGFRDFFTGLQSDYWSRHWNLSANPLARDLALVGGDRVVDLLTNAYLPSLPFDAARLQMEQLRGSTPGGRIQRACEWLVGRFDPALCRSAFHQQGLLQLLADFGSVTPLEAWAKIQSGQPGP